MALPVKQQATYWGIAAAIFFLLMWFLGQVLLPFVIGGAIAYCLDPLADRLERRGFTRTWATVVIFAFTVLLSRELSHCAQSGHQLPGCSVAPATNSSSDE